MGSNVCGMTTTTAPANARQFGRCPEKGCKTRIVVDPATDPRVKVQRRNGKTIAVEIDAAPGTDLGHNVLVGVHGMAFCATKHEVSHAGKHHVSLTWKGIKATLNHMECDSRCWSATGADCKCSCGGDNHGSQAG